jgi:hypothetical protein
MLDTLIESVHKLILDNLPIRSNRTPSGWITFDCPMCNDKRKRGGAIIGGAKISFHCFNCGYTTGWSPAPHMGKKYKDLAERLGASTTDIHAVQVELMKHSEELENVDDNNYVYSLRKFEPIDMPENVHAVEDLPDDHPVKQYAYERGILGLYPLLYFDTFPYKRRLIVPFMYDNEFIGFTGRHIAPPDKETPKYLHSLPAGYVFNVDRFAETEREVVIVTEGVFDAILVDGISVLGNNVTAEQAHLIDKLNKRVILCPDRDKAGKELIQQAVALGWEVSFPPWAPDIKDAADAAQRYGRLATVQSILNYATNNTVKIQVKTRML